ncbi:Mitogen-activated protein kinase kinase kinase 1 [Rhynchospora pubera]|uniref:mitogen-activated protein kinase kinase kinase n=1 Tax=Rhynchospora pubera TaxID=906938 RepID=A0AAV8FSQ5_9POAL|nr:Mitogen-activated protein kinase kinase kinase 1 [Rhynchospora pubera]
MNLIRKSAKPRTPKLERVNAIKKNFDYTISPDSSFSSTESSRHAKSLDLSSRPSTSSSYDFSSVTSFRIHGSGRDEIDSLCRSLGLSGTDDFGISIEAWEAARRIRSVDHTDSHDKSPLAVCSTSNQDELRVFNGDLGIRERSDQVREDSSRVLNDDETCVNSNFSTKNRSGERGIKGVRPPQLSTSHLSTSFESKGDEFPGLAREEYHSCKEGASEGINTLPPTRVLEVTSEGVNCADDRSIFPLAPPPCMSLPKLHHNRGDSIWDLVLSFGPERGRDEEHNRDIKASGIGSIYSDEEDDEEIDGFRAGETIEGYTGTSSLSTNNDDETSSTNTEAMFVVSPNGRFKKKIRSWMRGVLLGHGSFGMVYEGISDEGVFFAVKEVLADQGSNAKQCIIQLEQEIALLSQFEHENIVQYYGTDKEESKLYIFLELVTQGSLASLYEKYRLRDSQVSAYTRQILKGLEYLHERNIVHRDIKCANILVHANGSVKLADFGLAKEITKMNNLKSCKGSAYWMAPEVVNPKSTYGPPADIWSLGCTVLEMLTRQLPYPHLEWTQALFQIGQGVPPPIPTHLSKDARSFISQCVKVDAFDRPSASELLDHPFVKGSMQFSHLPASPRHVIDRWNHL